MFAVQKMFLLVSLIAISVTVTDVNGKGYTVFSMDVGTDPWSNHIFNLHSYNISNGNLTKLPVKSVLNIFGPMVAHQNKIYSFILSRISWTLSFVLLRNVSETFHTLATPLINHGSHLDDAYFNALSIEVGGKIYVLGGYNNGGRGFERYDPCTGSWEVLPSSQMAHSCGSLAEMYGNIYVCGGYSTSKSNFCEYYSIHANVWELLNYPMISSYLGTSLVTMNDTLFSLALNKDVAKFDFQIGGWEALTSLPNAEFAVNVAKDSDAIYVQTVTSIYRYDGNSTYNFLTAIPSSSALYSNSLVYVDDLPNYNCAQ